MENQMVHLLNWMMDYEIRSSLRYGHNFALVMMSTLDRQSVPKELLQGTLRGSDEFFDLAKNTALLMGETNREGALTAIERFCFFCSEDLDLRFSLASFPRDGKNSPDLLKKAQQRLAQAIHSNASPVVAGD